MLRVLRTTILIFFAIQFPTSAQPQDIQSAVQTQEGHELLIEITRRVNSPLARYFLQEYVDEQRFSFLHANDDPLSFLRAAEFENRRIDDLGRSLIREITAAVILDDLLALTMKAILSEIEFRDQCSERPSCSENSSLSMAIDEIITKNLPQLIELGGGDNSNQCTPIEDQYTQLCINSCLSSNGRDPASVDYHQCVSDNCVRCAEDESGPNGEAALWNGARWVINDQISQACNGVGEIDPSGYMLRDFDGDGREDILINHSAIRCSGGGNSIFCGAQVCTTKIFLRRGGLTTEFADFLGEVETVGTGSIPEIAVITHGGRRILIRWNGSSFVAQ